MTTERKCTVSLIGCAALCIMIGAFNAARARADDSTFARTIGARPVHAFALNLRP